MIQELDRKIPDLRTLNTLHSEKLLAFKMEEQNLVNAADQTQQMQLSPVSIASSHRSSSSVDSLDSFHNSTISHGSSCTDNDLPIPSPRRLSTSTCPYKFPRALESPSGDSGIESGACSSPARSEQDIPILPHTPNSSQDDMPVLKRALQAPPMIDTNLLMNEAYRPHKKFRYVSLFFGVTLLCVLKCSNGNL
jgi:nuclear receptor subfamily 1 group D protein 3